MGALKGLWGSFDARLQDLVHPMASSRPCNLSPGHSSDPEPPPSNSLQKGSWVSPVLWAGTAICYLLVSLSQHSLSHWKRLGSLSTQVEGWGPECGRPWLGESSERKQRSQDSGTYTQLAMSGGWRGPGLLPTASFCPCREGGRQETGQPGL